MLKINKQNISFARSESVSLNISIYTTDGEPLILPPYPVGVEGLSTVLAFTVRAGLHDKVMLVKYIDINNSPIIVDTDIVDYSANGYNKFNTQEILEVATFAEMVTEFDTYKKRVYKCTETGMYYFWASNTSDPEGDGIIGVYDFNFVLGLTPADTMNLSAKYYVYDLVAYIGKLKESGDGFPLQEVYWKKELISPHNFILEDTINV